MEIGNYIKKTTVVEPNTELADEFGIEQGKKIKTNYYLILSVDEIQIEVMEMSGTPFMDEIILDYEEIVNHGYFLNIFSLNDVTIKPVTEIVPNHSIFSGRDVAYKYIYNNKEVVIPIKKHRYWNGTKWIIEKI